MTPNPNNQNPMVRYATLLQRLCSPQYDMSISAECNPSPEEDKWLSGMDGAPMSKASGLITEGCGWTGKISMAIELRALRLNAQSVRPVLTVLERQAAATSLLAEAIFNSHVVAFQKFATLVERSAWESATRLPGKMGCHLTHKGGKGTPWLAFSVPTGEVARVLTTDAARPSRRIGRL